MRSLLFSGVALFLMILLLPIVRDLKRVRGGRRTVPGPGGEMVQDPACQMYLPKDTALRRVVRGEVHYFCSEACIKQFDRQPDHPMAAGR